MDNHPRTRMQSSRLERPHGAADAGLAGPAGADARVAAGAERHKDAPRVGGQFAK